MKKSERIFYESSSQLPLPRELSTPEKSGIHIFGQPLNYNCYSLSL